jgi:ankyrin repeat protein
MAVLSGDVNTVKTVIRCSKDNCIDRDVFGVPPLLSADRYCRVEVVRVMLEACANVDRSDTFGYTALHYAAIAGHLDVCRPLFDWGARMLPMAKIKFTPLHWTASRVHFSVVKLLVERG